MPGAKRSRGGQTSGSSTNTYSKARMVHLAAAARKATAEATGGYENPFARDYSQQEEFLHLADELGMNPKSAGFIEVVDTITDWGGSAYPFRNTEGDPQLEARRALLDYLADTGGYRGELWRGIHFDDMTQKEGNQWIKKMVERGVWTEPGPASFSMSRDVGESFADFQYGEFAPDDPKMGVRVLLHVKNATSGKNVADYTGFPDQDEILQSSNRGQRGWNITGSHTKTIDGQKYHILELEER